MQSVYVIRYADGKYKGNIVGVCQAPVPATQSPDECLQVLKLWVARAGLSERAILGFTIDFSPVVPWESLKKTLEPIG